MLLTLLRTERSSGDSCSDIDDWSDSRELALGCRLEVGNTEAEDASSRASRMSPSRASPSLGLNESQLVLRSVSDMHRRLYISPMYLPQGDSNSASEDDGEGLMAKDKRQWHNGKGSMANAPRHKTKG